MRFDRCALVFKLMRSGLEEEKPYWSYEDIGVFSLVLAALGSILHLFTRFHLLSRSELENPGLGLQFALIVSLILALYLVLKLRHRRPVLRPLGWVWPCTAYVIVAPLLGVLLAAGVSVYLRLRGQSTPTMPLVEIVILGLVLGPILEESFFRGCLLPSSCPYRRQKLRCGSYRFAVCAFSQSSQFGALGLIYWDRGSLRLDPRDVALYYCPGSRARCLQLGSFSFGQVLTNRPEFPDSNRPVWDLAVDG